MARLRRRRDRTRSVTFAEEKEQSCSSSVLHSTTTVPTPLGGRIGGSDPISARTGESLALTSTYRLLCSAYACTSSLKRLAGWAPAQKARQPWREQSGDAGAERFLSSRQECLVCYAGPAGGQIASGPFLDWGGHHHGTTFSCARRWGWRMWGLSRSSG